MNVLFDSIQADIKDAMLGGNPTKRDCLRALISEIKNQTVNAGREMTEEICMKAVQKAAKQHEDSIENFKAGNREDLALKEAEELAYLKKYLPKMLSDEETAKVLAGLLDDMKLDPADIKKNIGAIMKRLPANVDKKIAMRLLQAGTLKLK